MHCVNRKVINFIVSFYNTVHNVHTTALLLMENEVILLQANLFTFSSLVHFHSISQACTRCAIILLFHIIHE
ncbi:hypothetical protein T4E_994 [Trichinella pseudospiralis]|nr:hypothetical protein T4E_3982 [Trichinella pseudospiralis]KRX98227.1 hypothetical protein T4E_4676 [Trichinella pseudospiralis]KRX98285.1 hypothetical protein T4E_994 [Trichinella pseudospiralis]